MEFIALIIGLIYTVWFIRCMEKIASHLKSISETLERIQIQLENIKENMRREQMLKLWSGKEKESG